MHSEDADLDTEFDTKSVNINEPTVKKCKKSLMSQLLGDVFSKSADEPDQWTRLGEDLLNIKQKV